MKAIQAANVETTPPHMLTGILYKAVMKPVQMGCNKVVRLGSGRYSMSSGGSQPPYTWDGHKYACEDDFKEKEPCLVYSFGVFNDASFEEVMAARGIREFLLPTINTTFYLKLLS